VFIHGVEVGRRETEALCRTSTMHDNQNESREKRETEIRRRTRRIPRDLKDFSKDAYRESGWHTRQIWEAVLCKSRGTCSVVVELQTRGRV
jgi:hypothetical protein